MFVHLMPLRGWEVADYVEVGLNIVNARIQYANILTEVKWTALVQKASWGGQCAFPSGHVTEAAATLAVRMPKNPRGTSQLSSK